MAGWALMALRGTRSRAAVAVPVDVDVVVSGRRESRVPFAPAAGRKTVDVVGKMEGRSWGKEENGL